MNFESARFVFFDRFPPDHISGEAPDEPRQTKSNIPAIDKGLLLEAKLCADGIWRVIEVDDPKDLKYDLKS